jgi:hypothetical protein
VGNVAVASACLVSLASAAAADAPMCPQIRSDKSLLRRYGSTSGGCVVAGRRAPLVPSHGRDYEGATAEILMPHVCAVC